MICSFTFLSIRLEHTEFNFCREGYLRTCSEEYTLNEDNILNKFVHLTNNAIQKHGENYGNHESGNQLSFKDLEEYAKKHNVPMDFQGQVLPRMKELVNISMQSVIYLVYSSSYTDFRSRRRSTLMTVSSALKCLGMTL